MKVDMSPKAVTVRLKRVSQLRRLCLALGKARPVDRPVKQGAVADPLRLAQQPSKPKG
ncbi:MAG: hypothetical protein AABN33_17990 [Acidobacteriota bacterium]